MKNDTTKRIVTRNDDTMTFVIQCSSRDIKNRVFDIIDNDNNTHAIVYRAPVDEIKSTCARRIATIQKQFAIYALRNDNTRANECKAFLQSHERGERDETFIALCDTFIASHK